MLLALASWKQTDIVLEQISDCLDCSAKLGRAVASLKAPPKRRGRKAKVKYMLSLLIPLYHVLGCFY